MARLRGDRELMQTMRKLTQAPGGQTLDAVLRDGLEPMRAETEGNAKLLRSYAGKWRLPFFNRSGSPTGGHLDQGIVVAKVAGRGRNYRVFWLSFRRRARYLAHLVEFGTAPHYQPGLRWMHPGARPKPFARPAYEATKHVTVERIGKNIWAAITTSLRGRRVK